MWCLMCCGQYVMRAGACKGKKQNHAGWTRAQVILQ